MQHLEGGWNIFSADLGHYLKIAPPQMMAGEKWYQGTAMLNPLSIEAQKTIAYEVFEQGIVPNWFIVPTGSGGILHSIWKGFKELKKFGLIDELPKMLAVQPETCSSIAEASLTGKNEVEPAVEPDTIALAMMVRKPVYGGKALSAIRESGGSATIVSDAQILEAEKEIAELIKTIQSESRNAIQAVERGAQNVERGVEVSNEAERALKKILESSQKSTNMVRAIARATVEQAKGSRQVTDAIGRIAETVQQIAGATAQQARGSELIMTSGKKMRTIAQHVERSSQEQARGNRQITASIESISNMVNQLNASHRAQTRMSEQAAAAGQRLEEAVRNQDAALQQLATKVEGMRRVVE